MPRKHTLQKRPEGVVVDDESEDAAGFELQYAVRDQNLRSARVHADRLRIPVRPAFARDRDQMRKHPRLERRRNGRRHRVRIHVEHEQLMDERQRVVEALIASAAHLVERRHRLAAGQTRRDGLTHRRETVAFDIRRRAADQLIAGDRGEIADGTLRREAMVRAGDDGLPGQHRGQKQRGAEEDGDSGCASLVGGCGRHRGTIL